MANERQYSQIAGTHPTIGVPQRRNSLATSSSLAAPSLAPPRYSLIFQDSEDATVSAGTSPTNYTFSLPNGPTKGQPWVTLHIQTRASNTTPKNPRFFGGDNVSGTIDLNLANPQVINSINAVLRGRIAASAGGRPLTFLEERHAIWEKSNGDPRSQTPTKKFDGKSSGNYQFPFSFPFPEHVNLSSTLGGKGKNNLRNSLVSPTPPTILERGLGANVYYELILQITHGLLRPDSKLKTIVTYIPEIIPTPPSALRQNAYLEGTLLPGPDRDTDGWVTLPSVVVCGKLEIAHCAIDVQCTLSLSLASPLSYTRGTVIPCHLTLSSQNTKALELLADHKVQNVHLARTVQLFEHPLIGIDQFSQGKQPASFNDIREVGLAVWWVPPKDVIQNTYMRQLQGEIHLSSELPPSSTFLPLCISYAVEILPFDTEKFEHTPETNPNEDSDDFETVLQSQPVVIATVNGSGPLPTAFTEHARPRRKNNESFNNYGSSNGLMGSGEMLTPSTMSLSFGLLGL